MDPCECVDGPFQGEVFHDPPAGPAPELAPFSVVIDQALDGVGQGVRVARRHDEARLANDPSGVPDIGRDRSETRGHALGYDVRKSSQCRWLLRAAWTAQELLTTFEEELGEVALIPGTGGIFELSIISVYKTPSPIGFEGVRACFMASV